MYDYLALIFNICLFKKKPQDIPYSQATLRFSLIGYAIISFMLIQMSVNDLNALLQVAVELIIILGFSNLALSIAKKRQRFVQTTCALLGTDALISLCAAPVIATLSISPNNGLALLAIISLIIWHWLITAHIIRHALSQSFSFALGIAFLYIFSAYQIMGVLFPTMNPTN
ncbi:hypothetical protein [methanotrophic endosymbiont of Bathymodiolus puteoserpentis (Logatchev)]|jgi:asparagine N-glycosylation enzyme membrane subunit Stt3|uniref:hypothetical protein n=1 Tax=methanotrophic endosymbiont of Bathymodiolus puteoserpentis (Logatchev) TaxID=343235 RepID=UPI000B2438D7|nr:hypothetical protein [methanotrophic endosymbiont of Bathymodiolus puteoserpentis (Logatchev)]